MAKFKLDSNFSVFLFWTRSKNKAEASFLICCHFSKLLIPIFGSTIVHLIPNGRLEDHKITNTPS